MTTKTKRFVGLGLLLVAAAVMVVLPLLTSRGRSVVTVSGYSGGSKMSLLANPQVRDILRDRYGLAVTADERGSVAMVEGDTTGRDFLWPGSEASVERFLARGGKPVRTDTLVSSPLVFYSWDVVTTSLERAGVVGRGANDSYTVDVGRLVRLGEENRTWRELGLDQVYGRVTVFTSDPGKSNGGAMFAAMLATVLNNGDVVDDTSVMAVTPGVKRYYDRLGLLDATTADLFDKFLQTGMGAHPVVVGYESELIEFALAHPNYRDLLQQRVRVLYPQPTVWASHPLIALTPNGARLLEALADPDIKRIAWERHGFRSGPGGLVPSPAPIRGVPDSIDTVMRVPRAAVIDQLLVAVSDGALGARGISMTVVDDWPGCSGEINAEASHCQRRDCRRVAVGPAIVAGQPVQGRWASLFGSYIALTIVMILVGLYVGCWFAGLLMLLLPKIDVGTYVGAAVFMLFATAGSLVGVGQGHVLRDAGFMRAGYTWVPVSTAFWSSVAVGMVSSHEPINGVALLNGIVRASVLSVLAAIFLFAVMMKELPEAAVSPAIMRAASHSPKWQPYGVVDWFIWNFYFPLGPVSIGFLLVTMVLSAVDAIGPVHLSDGPQLLATMAPIMFAVAGTVVGLGQGYWMREAGICWAIGVWTPVSTGIWTMVAAFMVTCSEPPTFDHVLFHFGAAVGLTLLTGVFLQFAQSYYGDGYLGIGSRRYGKQPRAD